MQRQAVEQHQRILVDRHPIFDQCGHERQIPVADSHVRCPERCLTHAQHLHLSVVDRLQHHSVVLVGLHLQIHELPDRHLYIALELRRHILAVCQLYLDILAVYGDDLPLKCVAGLQL